MNAKHVQEIILLETKRNLKKYKKQYFQQHDRALNAVINETHEKYVKNRIKTDVNFRLIVYVRTRIYESLKGMIKQSSSRVLLGINIDTYRKWIEFQFTPEINWSNIEIDHVKPICMFDVSKDEELREASNWKNTQPLLKEVHQHKGIKYNFLDYQLQFIKAYLFIKLNAEVYNEEFHR